MLAGSFADLRVNFVLKNALQPFGTPNLHSDLMVARPSREPQNFSSFSNRHRLQAKRFPLQGDGNASRYWIEVKNSRYSQLEGREELFEPQDTVSKFQISTSGGRLPKWRADGKEIFFISHQGMMMSVPVESLEPSGPDTQAFIRGR